MTQSTPSFDSLPKFDATTFEPPEWAKTNFKTARQSQHDFKNDDLVDNVEEDRDHQSEGEEDSVDDPSSISTATLTTSELKRILARINELKAEGNRLFTSKPPRIEEAKACYLKALELIPELPRRSARPSSSGIEEVSEAEAAEIEASANPNDPERIWLEDDLRDCAKALWGNLAAAHAKDGEDKETVQACSKALDIDPNYVKVLQRRADANERIGSWTSLMAAQDDFKKLLELAPKASAQAANARRSLQTLPTRIKAQQEKETGEMLSKLKELGNGILGNFGLNTDMFKFEQQPGGGYSMRFER